MGERVRNFAWIGPEAKHIHLGFEHGTLLADPEHLLQGAQERLKKFRYFTFEPEIDIDEAILVDYLERAAELAILPSSLRRTLAETAAEDDRARATRPGRYPRAPGPSRRRPRTQAPRTMSGWARKISREARSSGSSSDAPGTAATYDGSTAMTSASLPASSDPIASSRPSARAPSSEPIRSQSSGVGAGSPASPPTRNAFWA